MVDKEKDDYLRLYKELVDRINQKEEIIEDMTQYIAKFASKTKNMCKRNKVIDCNEKQCKRCVREYFEERCK